MKANRPPAARQASQTKQLTAPGIQVPKRWAWHYHTLVALRDRLRVGRGEHIHQAAELIEPHGMSPADSATDEFDHDLALALLSEEQEGIYEVEQALSRIHDGTYGLCEVTGRPIDPARLRAVPWTRYCRTTQAELERDR